MSKINWFGKKKSSQTSSESPPKKMEANRTNAPSYHQIHGENHYDSSLRQIDLTRAYSTAEEKLRPKPYAERKFKTKENIIRIRGFYPYLSVLLSLSVGIMTGDLFASGLSEMGYFLTLGLLTLTVFVVAWLLEDLKRDACRDYFSTGNPNAKQRFWLNSLFMYSLIISGIGGYVASIHLNDRSAEIEAVYQNQSDSVSVNYGEQLDVLNAIIAENQNRMQSSSKWVRYHAQKDLAEAQGQKVELLKLQSNQLSDLKTEKKEVLLSEDTLNQYKAYVIVLIVFLLETLYIRSFAYEYAVERKIKSENYKYKVVKPATDQLPTSEPLTIQDIAMQMLLSHLTGEGKGLAQTVANQPAYANPYNYPNSQPHFTAQAGFKFGENVTNSSDSESSKDGNIQNYKSENQSSEAEKPLYFHACNNCGNIFRYTHWNARYCSDKCRKDAWEKRIREPKESEHLKEEKPLENVRVRQSQKTESPSFEGENPSRACDNCGNEFEYNHWNARWCSDKCHKEAREKRVCESKTSKLKSSTNERAQVQQTESQASEEEKPSHTRACAHCGNEFEHKHWNARYCSDKCRKDAWEERTGRKLKKR